VLQLQTKDLNIGHINNLLTKYNVKHLVTTNEISLDGNISESLLNELCKSIDIISITNYSDKELVFDDLLVETENLITSIPQAPTKVRNKYSYKPYRMDLINLSVKYGQVYVCDFGTPYATEMGYERYAIVVQNDCYNSQLPTTVVIPCTTKRKLYMPVHYHCLFSRENMIDYDVKRVGTKENYILTEQIKTVDKTRLRKYIGTLTPEFMRKLKEKIYILLN